MAHINNQIQTVKENLKEECNQADLMLTDERIPELEFFMKISRNYYDPDRISQNPPKIVVVGSVFPINFMPVAMNTGIFWIPGGGRTCTSLSDEWLPRDTDPVSRSILGQILLLEEQLKDSIMLVPLYNDAQKKILTHLIDRGFHVTTLDFPSDKSNETLFRIFEKEVEKVRKLMAISMKSLNYKKLTAMSSQFMEDVAAAVDSFNKVTVKCRSFFPGTKRLFVKHSFYMTDRIEEWLENQKRLTARLEEMSEEAETAKTAKVLIAGSSIFYPNFKIPEIIKNTELTLTGLVDSTYGMFKACDGDLKTWLANDCTASYVRNDALINAVRHEIEVHNCDGIIWHVLKGQIEYDYELTRFEESFNDHELPILRLETDYYYQDVEQLRIRVEAFAEMLKTRKSLEK